MKSSRQKDPEIAEVGGNGTARPRAAIVTGGAGSGIGSGIVASLLHQNWSVLVLDRDTAAARALAESLAGYRGRLELLREDITAPGIPEAAVARAVAKFGGLDGLVNNAGVGLAKPLADVDDAAFDRLFAIDFRAVFRFCRAALPELMRTRGAIVNIGSIQAHRNIPGYALYGACKAAVEALTRGLAVDYGPSGVRANCIHPGFVPSAQGEALIATFAPDPKQWIADYARTKQAIPAMIEPAQIGRLTAFLLDPANTAITGQAIVADAGTSSLMHDRQ